MLTPEFWQGRRWRDRLTTLALSPLGWAYSGSVALKSRRAKPYRPNIPVVCIGNLTAGGVGKTPIAIAVVRHFSALGGRPFFLSRGYGGKLAGPIRVIPEHRAVDVGDEPLLLAAEAPAIVAHNRALGAKLAETLGASVLVMDDGHQNFSIAKDLSFVVVDAAQGFGNGRVLPAGPLREFVRQGLKRADAVIVVGDGEVNLRDFSGPVLQARIVAAAMPTLRGAKVAGFAGIGRPEKFFQSLEACGAVIVAAKRFADHHVYTSAEIAYLRATAHERGAVLVTTAKDYVRLIPTEREGIQVLPVEARFDQPDRFAALLMQRTRDNADEVRP